MPTELFYVCSEILKVKHLLSCLKNVVFHYQKVNKIWNPSVVQALLFSFCVLYGFVRAIYVCEVASNGVCVCLCMCKDPLALCVDIEYLQAHKIFPSNSWKPLLGTVPCIHYMYLMYVYVTTINLSEGGCCYSHE